MKTKHDKDRINQAVNEAAANVPLVGERRKEDHSPVNDYTPQGQYIAIEPFWVGQTDSGLVLPGNSSGDYQTPSATVLSVGPDAKFVKVGDVVYVHPQVMLVDVILPTKRRFYQIKEEHVLGKKVI